MKVTLLITILMFVVGIKVYSQDFNKTILSKEDPDWLYTNDGESDTLFYLDLTPTLKSETILILMSGWHRKSEDIFKRTSLPDEAYHRGIPTIIPSLNTRLHSDTSYFELINKMILDYSIKQGVKIKNIIVGGMSAGGIMSLNYTIYMVKNPHEIIPIPKAVVTVDPPVDLQHFWLAVQHTGERDCIPGAKASADYVRNYFNNYLGGTPYDVPEKYIDASPFTRDRENGGNTYYLKDIPLRIYTEIDVEWFLDRCIDLSDMYALLQSVMINTLRILGNENADFIVSYDKGYRLDGTRNPHSWSILDAEDCVDWIEEIVYNQ